MNFLVSLILGLAVGWLASRLAGRLVADSRFGMMGDLVAGAAGAVAAGIVANRLVAVAGGGFNLPALAITVLGAVLVVAGLRVLSGDIGTGRRHAPATPLSAGVRRVLSEERALGEQDAAALRMMQQRGDYAGRSVTYFQVFDPGAVQAQGADLSRPDTIDPRNFLHSGFIERDGRIVLNQAPRKPVVSTPATAI